MRRALIASIELATPFIVAAAAWQAFSLLGPFPQKLFPGVETIIATFVRLTASGILPIHALHTVLRLIIAFLLAGLAGVALGIIIGRYRWAEDFFLPLVSIGNPIPGLAYAPLFVLWFGLGDLPAVLLVAFAAAFPIVLNTDVMLAGIAVIGIVGLLLEKLVFQKIEQSTIVRWGMMQA